MGAGDGRQCQQCRRFDWDMKGMYSIQTMSVIVWKLYSSKKSGIMKTKNYKDRINVN